MGDVGNKEIMAENISYYLNKHGISQKDICTDLNFKESTFSDWVNAKSYPRIDKIELIANYFHIDKAELIESHKEYDVDIRRIQRAREKMSEQERTKMMKILEASFDDYFGDNFIDEDND